MKRLIALVARLYPRSWRAEFGEEFDAVLGDVRPRWRVFANVLGGAIAMQISAGTGWLKLVGVMAAVGAIVGGGASFRVLPTYSSSAVISVTPQPDPVRPVSPEALRARAAEHIAQMETQILSRTNLSAIIQDPRNPLYQDERGLVPAEDVIEQMRRNIRIQPRPSTDHGGPIVFSIFFSYPDRVKAQAVVRALENKFAEENAVTTRRDADAYRNFWGDMTAVKHTKPAPPPPVGDVLEIINAASQPAESDPNRFAFLAWGLGAGVLLGLLAALALRWPRAAWRLGGFALAGCFLAACISFLIPNVYTSTAVMEIDPVQITEDPLQPIPGVTPAAELLRQMEPQVLSAQNLTRIIEHSKLYSAERAKQPMDEVVRNMAAHAIRIAPLNPASATKGVVSAFSISFTYSDRYKAQEAVWGLLNSFEENYMVKLQSDASRSSILHDIAARKAGEVLDVLDPASLPVLPVKPNRWVISGIGLVSGLLVGAVVIWFGRPRGLATPAAINMVTA